MNKNDRFSDLSLKKLERLDKVVGMKLDQLQYFVETARRQHIGHAARFLNISPSAISHSIAALEEEFGQVLFEKQGRQIKLTHHGKLLLDRAEFLLTEANRIREELSNDRIELRGHYRIAATHVFCSDFLVPTWLEIQRENPGLTATLHSMKSAEVLARVNSGEIDLGICLSPHSGPNYELETLYQGKLLLCFGKKHPFLKNRKMEDLGRYPSIAALAAQGIENCENHEAFQKFRITQKISNFYDSYDVALRALKGNAFWALLPDLIAYKYSSIIETHVPRGWDADYQVAAIWPKYRIRTQALDRVVEEVRASIRESALRSKSAHC
jgi:DNA-binding transcriptional LysR family regulator